MTDTHGNKEIAESLLRELPGVVGAFVQADGTGNPREIHLLIKAGPRPREFAQQVKTVLEAQLRIPIDQRIVSIAQLAAEKPPHRFNAPAPTPVSSPGDMPLARLRLQGVDAEVRGNYVTVHVRIEHESREIVCQATEVEAGEGRARAAGVATVEAVNRIAGDHARFGLDFAAPVHAVGQAYALASVIVTSPHLGRRPVTVSGAHRVEDDIETATALSVLKATNRLLGFVRGRALRRPRFPHGPLE
jgi:hypothetical protein